MTDSLTPDECKAFRDEMNESISKLNRVVWEGNGRPSLVDSVTRIQDDMTWIRRILSWVAGGVLTIAVGLVLAGILAIAKMYITWMGGC